MLLAHVVGDIPIELLIFVNVLFQMFRFWLLDSLRGDSWRNGMSTAGLSCVHHTISSLCLLSGEDVMELLFQCC